MTKALTVALHAPFAWAGALFGGAVTLCSAAMAPKLVAIALFGPICSGHAASALHCPACYAAAALAGLAAGLALTGVMRLRRI